MAGAGLGGWQFGVGGFLTCENLAIYCLSCCVGYAFVCYAIENEVNPL